VATSSRFAALHRKWHHDLLHSRSSSAPAGFAVTAPSIVTGWGAALPPDVVTNADLEARIATSHQWIVERSGIHQRHVGGSVAGLATEAGQSALRRSSIDPASVDLVVVATSTPDEVIPPAASTVHYRLGLGGGVMDVNGACAGFIPALLTGFGALSIGARRVLVIGADCMSRITDPTDRSTAILFGDGAGALLLQAADGRPPEDGGPGLVAYDMGSDGSAHDLLACANGGAMIMDGREVFRRAVRLTVESATAALELAKLSIEDVALFVPHQANLRIIEAVGARLGIDPQRTAVIVDRTGNTSAASIPIALAAALDAGRVNPGDLVLLAGFGAGLSWGSMLVRWGG